jgi:pimeloyl-ACP methyl ester carboxylesterase
LFSHPFLSTARRLAVWAALLPCCLVLSACCNLFGPTSYQPLPAQPPEVVPARQPGARGVFIVVHGLNQRPDTMHEITRLLGDLGYHTYRISLRGHEKHEEAPFPATAWIDDLHTACSLMHSRFPNSPLHILGYSLGGLITTRAIDTHSSCNPKSMILIAPALSLRNLVQSGYLLAPFPQLTIAVPNIAPSLYRRFQHTPLFWYQNLFSLYSKTRTLASQAKLASLPTLVFANPRDELVSLTGLRDWIHNNSLEPNWHISPIHPKPRNPFIPEHVMIDPYSLGELEWQHLSASIRDFLR